MSKTTVVSLRLNESQVERVRRFARRFGRSVSDTGSLFLEEAMRHEQFPLVEFRDSSIGRQAYVAGSSLAVWEVVAIGKEYAMESAATAAHLNWDEFRVKAAFQYYRAYSQEIDDALAENDSYDESRLQELFPDLEVLEV